MDSYLWALGLSQSASQKIRPLQYSLWQKSNDIGAIALLPLIPLFWTKTISVSFEQFKVPSLPEQISFDKVSQFNDFLYLDSYNKLWVEKRDGLILKLKEYSEEVVTENSPFFTYPAILLGKGEKESLEFETIDNNDWRLLLLNCQYRTINSRIIHFNYRIENSRHLI
ncbi:MAG: hypothetical protein WCY53_01015 [Sphaerochaetaceae bacterium]